MTDPDDTHDTECSDQLIRRAEEQITGVGRCPVCDTPLAGYGTHARRSRDELVADVESLQVQNAELLSRARKKMLDQETTKAQVVKLEAELAGYREALEVLVSACLALSAAWVEHCNEVRHRQVLKP